MAINFNELVTHGFERKPSTEFISVGKKLEVDKLVPANPGLPEVSIFYTITEMGYKDTTSTLEPPLIQIKKPGSTRADKEFNIRQFTGLHGIFDIKTHEMIGFVLDSVTTHRDGSGGLEPISTAHETIVYENQLPYDRDQYMIFGQKKVDLDHKAQSSNTESSRIFF